MTVRIEYPPGGPGVPPHRHPGGPCFGYVLEGEMGRRRASAERLGKAFTILRAKGCSQPVAGVEARQCPTWLPGACSTSVQSPTTRRPPSATGQHRNEP
ncbi:cupin domain-containing protein [Streptomyces sp. NPDC047085]|uniref:cupin domain-containing protein n=1 Tax=Streptomyces sp. NPDC047085 TaxID=3155140 RepID=UPI0033CC96FE